MICREIFKIRNENLIFNLNNMRNLLRLVVLILILVVGNVVGMMFLFFIANLDQMKDGLILG
jgi:hypothetical protein